MWSLYLCSARIKVYDLGFKNEGLGFRCCRGWAHREGILVQLQGARTVYIYICIYSEALPGAPVCLRLGV